MFSLSTLASVQLLEAGVPNGKQLTRCNTDKHDHQNIVDDISVCCLVIPVMEVMTTLLTSGLKFVFTPKRRVQWYKNRLLHKHNKAVTQLQLSTVTRTYDFRCRSTSLGFIFFEPCASPHFDVNAVISALTPQPSTSTSTSRRGCHWLVVQS